MLLGLVARYTTASARAILASGHPIFITVSKAAFARSRAFGFASPKSNSAYLGINDAIATVKQTGNLPVPLHIRNAPTKLMKDLGYHDGYKYPHDYPGHFTEQQYLPDELKDARFWHPQHSPSEERLYNWMVTCWGERFR